MDDKNIFADTSKVCKAASYLGLGSANEEFTFKIKMKKIDKF